MLSKSSSKSITANGTKAMKHALITEIQLGRSIKEVADSLCEELNFQCDDVAEELDQVIKALIHLNKPHIRFHVDFGDSSCYVRILDKDWPNNLSWDYWDDDYGSARDDDAYNDCEELNQVVQTLFGVEHKSVKPIISQKEFIEKKGKICPFCGAKTIASLDCFMNMRTATVNSCTSCEEEWEEEYKMVLVKYHPRTKR